MANTNDVAETWGRPYCANCGHDLSGLVDSSRCVECGKPLVEVLVREARRNVSFKRYTSRARILGLPAIAVARGIGPDGRQGHAKGWIAIGDKSTGVVALGGYARGVVAIGGTAVGGFAFGGLALGLIGSFGGFAVAPLGLAIGGMAIGGLGWGGMAAGFGAIGGTGFGYHTWAPSGFGVHRVLVRGGPGDPAAIAFFEHFEFLFGPASGRLSMLRPIAWMLAAMVSLGGLLSAPAVLRWSRDSDDGDSAKDGGA